MPITIGQITRMYADWIIQQDPSKNWHNVHYSKSEKLKRHEFEQFEIDCVNKYGPLIAGHIVFLAVIQDPDTKFREHALFSSEADAMNYVSKTIAAFTAKHGKRPWLNFVSHHYVDAHTQPTPSTEAKKAPTDDLIKALRLLNSP